MTSEREWGHPVKKLMALTLLLSDIRRAEGTEPRGGVT